MEGKGPYRSSNQGSSGGGGSGKKPVNGDGGARRTASGKPKEFKQRGEAKQAYRDQKGAGVQVDDRKAPTANSQQARRQGGGNNNNNNNNSNSNVIVIKAQSSAPSLSREERQRRDRARAARKAENEATKIPEKAPFTAAFVNLSPAATEETFRNWLAPRRFPVKEMRWKQNACYVDFETREALVEALKLGGSRWLGRVVVVRVAKALKKNSRRRDGKAARFPEHMPVNEAKKLVEQKQLHQGVLRINPHNRREGYATLEGFAFDVKFVDLIAQNRAYDGDVIAVKLLPESEWIEMEEGTSQENHLFGGEEVDEEQEVSSLEEDEDDQVDDETDDTDKEQTEDSAVAAVPAARALSDTELLKLKEGDGGAAAGGANNSNNGPMSAPVVPKKKLLRPVGVVVSILERRSPTSYVGWLRSSANADTAIKDDSKFAHFIPFSKKMHRVLVPLSSLPATWRSAEKYAKHLYRCEIKGWSASEMSPLGHLVKDYGEGGNLEVEKTILLESNNIDYDDSFSVAVNACLPSKEFRITAEEVAKRRDFRNVLVCSIDPATAKDLDDALSIEPLPNGNFSVGVHIADVTHFVKPGTALDDEARSRCTSVYLVDQCIPMLPRILSEQLCSLNTGQDSLAFSAVFEMTPGGDVVGEWFGKTVIRNAMQMSYDLAQNILDGNAKPEDYRIDPTTRFKFDDVKEAVLSLNKLAAVMRERRFQQSGSIALESVKLTFKLDEAGKPISIGQYHQKPANELVEEFMLLANRRVAEFCIARFPSGALLRKHEKPGAKMKDFVALCAKFGFKIDATSSFTLNKSLDALNDTIRPVLYHLALRAMQLAKYCETDEQLPKESAFWHYALAFPIYTHFTSPIRRFADCMVHRILHAAIERQPQPYTKEDVRDICANCNERKVQADRASERSDIVFLCHYLKGKKVEERKAYVYRLTEKGFDVMLPEFGIEDAVMLADLGLVKEAKLDSNKGTLSFVLDSYNEDYFLGQQPCTETRPLAITVSMFQKVTVVCVEKEKREMDMGLRAVITGEGVKGW